MDRDNLDMILDQRQQEAMESLQADVEAGLPTVSQPPMPGAPDLSNIGNQIQLLNVLVKN